MHPDRRAVPRPVRPAAAHRPLRRRRSSSGCCSRCRPPGTGRSGCCSATASRSASRTRSSATTSASTSSACRSSRSCSTGCSPRSCSSPCWCCSPTCSTAASYCSRRGRRCAARPRRTSPCCWRCWRVVKAGDYWVTRYELTTERRGFVQGATYSVVNAQLPAVVLLVLIALLVAGLFLSTLQDRLVAPAARRVGRCGSCWRCSAASSTRRRSRRWWSTRTRRTARRTYIERNIDATRQALGIDDVDEVHGRRSVDLDRDRDHRRRQPAAGRAPAEPEHAGRPVPHRPGPARRA